MLTRRAVPIALAVGALLTFGHATPARAQDIPTVFAHGIFSSAETWDFIGPFLAERLKLTKVAKSTTFYQTEAFQASQLTGELNADPLTSSSSLQLPFVAHSNGGLVSRRLSIDDARLRKLATVATPHQGSWLANNWLQYNVLNYAHAVGDQLLSPVEFYANNDPEVPLVLEIAADLFWSTWDYFFYILDSLMCPVAGMCVVFDGVNTFIAPLSYDLQYQSPTIANTLNSQGNLNREASAIASRVGLYTGISLQNGLFHLAFPSSWNNWGIAREATILAYLSAWDHYGESGDFNLWYNRYRWFDGAFALVDLDAHWYDLIGSLDYYYRYTNTQTGYYETELSAFLNDGLVDHRSAGYPSGTLTQRIYGNLSHTEQTSSQAVADKLLEILRTQFGIPDRDPPPPPPPQWSVVIHGPSSGQPGEACYFYVSTNIQNAQYAWTVNGNPAGSAQEIWVSENSSYSLQIQAWNSEGAGGSDSRTVSIAYENGHCYVE